MAENRSISSLAGKYLGIGMIGCLVLALITGAIFLSTKNNTLGTDFFIYYVAGRTLTIDHGSPYDESVGEQSQMAILKHPAGQNEDQLRFVYPPYALFPVLPLTGLPFPWAQAGWMAFNIMALAISVLVAFRKAPVWFLISLFFLFPFSFGLLLGNLNIPVICILILLAGRLPGLERHQKVESCLLGILMAWATIKPQFAGIYLLFFFLLAIKKKNLPLIIGFFSGLAGLLAVCFLILSDWISRWVEILRRYPSYTGGRIPITPLVNLVFPGGQMAVYILLAIFIILLTGWFFIQWWKDKFPSLALLSWCGFAVFFFHPTGVSYEQMIFLFPVILWILQRWPEKPRVYILVWMLLVIISWVFLYFSVAGIWSAATYYGLYLLYSLWALFG
ncbi:MAG TPA: glycosyltransferase family 87 protein, partial [Leptolinea sp.]